MLTRVYKREGVVLADAFGGAYPEYFVHPAAEYQALVRYTGLLDLTHRRILRATGADRLAFLNAMLTNDIAALEPGTGCPALITTIKGKIVAELRVFAREDDVLVVVAQGDAAETLAVLRKHIIMEDVTIDDVMGRSGILALEGPKSEDVLWRMFSKGPFPKTPFTAVEREFGGGDVTIMRCSAGGGDGFHMMAAADTVERMHRYLVQACRGSDGLPVGRVAWNIRRVENGVPWYGLDFSQDNFPDEVRLGHTVSYTKGCFRGQETLARLHHRGHVNRVLAGLTVDESSVPAARCPVGGEFEGEINNYDEPALMARAAAVAGQLDVGRKFPRGAALTAAPRKGGGGGEPGAGAKPAGHITSAVYSPTLKKPLLLADVRAQIAAGRQDVFFGDTKLVFVDLPLPSE